MALSLSPFFQFHLMRWLCAIYSIFFDLMSVILIVYPKDDLSNTCTVTNIKISHKHIDWPYIVYVCDQCTFLVASLLVSLYAATHHSLLFVKQSSKTNFFQQFFSKNFDRKNSLFKIDLNSDDLKHSMRRMQWKKPSDVKTIKKKRQTFDFSCCWLW